MKIAAANLQMASTHFACNRRFAIVARGSVLLVQDRNHDGNDQLQPLASAGVGALALTYVNTPFDINNYANAMLGQIRSSGVFLQEDGKAGTIQQVDLTV